jgi:hypothetical protein
MTSAAFDTLGYFEKLKAAGVPESQAKAHTDAMREIIEDRLATKQDLRELEARLTVNLTNRFGVMLAAAVALLAALIKIL